MSTEPRSAKETIEAIIADGKLTRAELKELDGALLAELLGRIASGQLQVLD